MSKPGFFLTMKKGPVSGLRLDVRIDRMILGSADDADIVIAVQSVDPHHASLTFEGQRLILTDLGSQGGTFRNDQRLLGPLQVFPGDRIGLGPEVELVLDGQQPAGQKAGRDEGEMDPGLVGSEAG